MRCGKSILTPIVLNGEIIIFLRRLFSSQPVSSSRLKSLTQKEHKPIFSIVFHSFWLLWCSFSISTMPESIYKNKLTLTHISNENGMKNAINDRLAQKIRLK